MVAVLAAFGASTASAQDCAGKGFRAGNPSRAEVRERKLAYKMASLANPSRKKGADFRRLRRVNEADIGAIMSLRSSGVAVQDLEARFGVAITVQDRAVVGDLALTCEYSHDAREDVSYVSAGDDWWWAFSNLRVSSVKTTATDASAVLSIERQELTTSWFDTLTCKNDFERVGVRHTRVIDANGTMTVPYHEGKIVFDPNPEIVRDRMPGREITDEDASGNVIGLTVSNFEGTFQNASMTGFTHPIEGETSSWTFESHSDSTAYGTHDICRYKGHGGVG